jgi:glucose/arabinose dehydrogenase
LSSQKVQLQPVNGTHLAPRPRVIYVPFTAGRPVGLAVDNMGALLVADDVGNTIWRVTAR